MYDDLEFDCPPCPVCFGDTTFLGALGWLAYYRCRSCGSDTPVKCGPPPRPTGLVQAVGILADARTRASAVSENTL